MRQSTLFPKTQKTAPTGAESANHKLLVRAGFIDQLMSGSFSLLPLGLRVAKKIEQIIREEMNKIGAQELALPLLHPKEVWNETGRWEKARDIMYQFKKDEREYALSFTHEEIFLDLARKHISTYRDFPVKLYQFSSKFRNELRAKSGILRGREFIMKDLYSLHTSKEDLDKYYFEVADAYMEVFKRMGLAVIMTEAAGGVFTDENTHEFQLLAESGEDEIIYCPGGDFAQNTEIATVKEGKQCDLGHGPLLKAKAIEVGNIFRFGTAYSEKMNVSYTDSGGKKQFAYLGSYGIGVTRLVGSIVEVSNDERGIIWPKSVSPFDVHLVSLDGQGEKVYEELRKAGIDVLWDDREDVSAGEKFADCDLIGIPVRLVVSKKAGEGKVEWKERKEDRTEIISIDDAKKRLKS
ncbi:MAG: aminoacyl--tRNA ligase-related protein [Candidatus Curtissbacteria bacterium]|nr:aminoacyl--tRNA ligase-related protein [Candidatus Curtissbacteria bacterium]